MWTTCWLWHRCAPDLRSLLSARTSTPPTRPPTAPQVEAKRGWKVPRLGHKTGTPKGSQGQQPGDMLGGSEMDGQTQETLELGLGTWFPLHDEWTVNPQDASYVCIWYDMYLIFVYRRILTYIMIYHASKYIWRYCLTQRIIMTYVCVYILIHRRWKLVV